MPTEKQIWDETFKAGADLSAAGKQFLAVKITGGVSPNNTIDVASAATDRCVGILQNKPAANQAAEIRLMGISRAISDGSGTSIAAGDYVGPNSSGKMVKKATADYNVLGIALDPSTANGTIIGVLLLGGASFFRTAAG